MEFLKKMNIRTLHLFIGVGLILLSILLVNFLGFGGPSRGFGTMGESAMIPTMYTGTETLGAPTLSARNVSDSYMPPIDGGYTAGDVSEAFEVKEYSAQIETRNLTRDCDAVHALKTRTDVIFEHANTYTHGCTFTFKVKKGSVDEVLALIQNMDPRDLTESTYTIKREVDDYTSEITILENKLATLDKTLADAITSYENITALATNRGDVENLAKIIESKLSIIERLTLLRIETVNALERVERTKGEALDRLEYTYFTVSVYENTFVDGDTIRDSWKAAVRTFVQDANTLVQDISIGLLGLFLLIVKFALYFVILLITARVGWTFAEKIWHTK